MRPTESPLSSPNRREGGYSSPEGSTSRAPAASTSESTDRFYDSLTQEDFDFAQRWGLTYDPPTDNPETRRYFRFAEDSNVDLIETLPWPHRLRFCLPSALQKRVRALTTAFINARKAVENKHPSASPAWFDMRARDEVRSQQVKLAAAAVAAAAPKRDKPEATPKPNQQDAMLAEQTHTLRSQTTPAVTTQPTEAPVLSPRPRREMPPRVASGAPLFLCQSAASNRRDYVIIKPPSVSRIESPTHRTARSGEKYLEPSTREKRLYDRTRTVPIVFDGWPVRYETALPEQDAVLVDFLCPSKTYMADQVLSHLDLLLMARSDGIPSFHWQIHTGAEKWTTLTSRDDFPDFGSEDATLRVTSVQRRSRPPRRAASQRHNELWSKPWNEMFQPLLPDVIRMFGGVAKPELRGYLFLTSDHRDFAVDFLLHIRNAPLYIALLDQLDTTMDGYSWWSLSGIRMDSDRVPEDVRWAAIRDITSTAPTMIPMALSSPPDKHSIPRATLPESLPPESRPRKRRAVDPRPPPPPDDDEPPRPRQTGNTPMQATQNRSVPMVASSSIRPTVTGHYPSQQPTHTSSTSPPIVDDIGYVVDFDNSPVHSPVRAGPTTQHQPTHDSRVGPQETKRRPFLTQVKPESYIYQTDVKLLASTRVTNTYLPPGREQEEINQNTRNFYFFLRTRTLPIMITGMRFPRPLLARYWVLPDDSHPPWPKPGKPLHSDLRTKDAPSMWYFPGKYSETYPMTMLDFEAGLPSLPTFEHLASLIYLSKVAMRPISLTFLVTHPTPIERVFLDRYTSESLASNTVCIDDGKWLQEALSSNLLATMNPITLNERLNQITGLDRFKTTTTTDDVVSYAEMRERHNYLIRWAIEQQDPRAQPAPVTTPHTTIPFWYKTAIAATLTRRSEVINAGNDKDSAGDVVLAATPSDDTSGCSRITCSKLRSVRFQVGQHGSYNIHYLEPVTFRELLFPGVSDRQWERAVFMTDWRQGPIESIPELDIYRLADDLTKAVSSTVPHQKLNQKFFSPGAADTR